MYTPEFLRQKAAQCRQLAQGSVRRRNASRKNGYLLDLANRLDEEARQFDLAHAREKPTLPTNETEPRPLPREAECNAAPAQEQRGKLRRPIEAPAITEDLLSTAGSLRRAARKIEEIAQELAKPAVERSHIRRPTMSHPPVGHRRKSRGQAAHGACMRAMVMRHELRYRGREQLAPANPRFAPVH